MSPESPAQAAALDTIPKYLLRNARDYADRPAMREKRYGIWQSWTWGQAHREVGEFAAGLHALGLRRGARIAILGRNCPRLYWGIAAAQCLGAVPVPVYADSVAEEMQYVLAHAEVTFALAEDQEQVDKLIQISEALPGLTEIIYDDPRGLEQYTAGQSYESVQERGRALLAEQPGFIDESIAGTRGPDIAIFLYTSGTTGRPKGVVLSQENIVITTRNSIEYDQLTAEDEVLAYLPLAWVGDHIFSYAQSHVAGFCVNCPESEHTVTEDLREIGPTYYFAPPRVFEMMLTHITNRMEDAHPLKRRLVHYFLDVAHAHLEAGDLAGVWLKLRYRIGEYLVYGPLKNRLGLSRVRLAYTAGEAIGPETFAFYRALGINLKQLYGQTEASVFITMQPNGECYDDSVGRPAPQVEVDITDSGEVRYRSPGVFLEYYKNPEATESTKDGDNWVYTGDAGFFADNGHLKIIDRVKDVGRLNDGTLFAPKFLENKLKFFPQIQEAVTFGHERDFVVAFINIDLESVGKWAERNGLPYASYQELAGHPKVYALIEQNLAAVNRGLAQDRGQASAQIRRFLILPKELDADDGEITRTRKVRRAAVMERYGDLVEALYSGRTSCEMKTEVTFEDGRSGELRADIRIAEAQVQAPMDRAA